LFLGLSGLLLFRQGAAARADVRVGVPAGIRHPGGRDVLQRGVAGRLRRAREVRETLRVPGGPAVRAEDRVRETVAAGRAAGVGVQADQLRAGEVAVRQRAVRLAAVLGDVRGQGDVQAAGGGRGVQDRHHRAGQLPAQHTRPARQERPVPGDVQARAEPGQARAGRDLRAGGRVAGQLLRGADAGPRPGLAGRHVLHQEVLVRGQLQPRAEGVQPVAHAHRDHVHVARVVSAVRGRVADGRVQDRPVQVLRPVQGAAFGVEGLGRSHHARRATVGGRRVPGADQCELRAPVGVVPAVRRLLLPDRDHLEQEHDRGAAQTARARGSRQAVSAEQAERVHQTARQTPQSRREQRGRYRRVVVLVSLMIIIR